MNPNRINTPVVTTIVVLLVAALAFFAYLMLKESRTPSVAEEPPRVEEEDQTGMETRLIAKHEFVDGKHIVAGEFTLPTPCHVLTVTPHFIDDDERNVELQYSPFLVEGEICAQVLTQQTYKVEFEAPADAVISASINGEPAVLNLVDVPEGEDIESFDEYYKG